MLRLLLSFHLNDDWIECGSHLILLVLGVFVFYCIIFLHTLILDKYRFEWISTRGHYICALHMIWKHSNRYRYIRGSRSWIIHIAIHHHLIYEHFGIYWFWVNQHVFLWYSIEFFLFVYCMRVWVIGIIGMVQFDSESFK